MRLILTGGTGFVGTALREILTQKGHEVVILTRQASREKQPGIRTRYVYWNPPGGGPWERELDGMDGVINLAGEPLVGKRWTAEHKQKIEGSRAGSTRAIVEAIRGSKRKPLFLINASAVGYYGSHENEELTEENPAGKDYLAQTCQKWEMEALRAEAFDVRVVRLRIGIVLEKGGGALAKMLPPFQMGLGGPLGSGRQWMSWIHREDLTGLILWAIEKKEIRGAFNATAPAPVTMKEFSGTLGRALHRPAIFPVPEFAVKLLLGEMSEVLLKGQRVLPKRALSSGYSFRFPKLEQALQEILAQ